MIRIVHELARDTRHALRSARAHPGFAAIVIVSLALGIGAATTVFGLAYNVLFAPLDLPRPQQLVQLVRVGTDGTDDGFSWNELLALRGASTSGTLATNWGGDNVGLANGTTRDYANLEIVDGEFFPMLGLHAASGRLIGPGDDHERANVIVLSPGMAARLFPADSSALGRTVTINGGSFAVIGITPRSYRGLDYPGAFRAAIPQGAAVAAGLSDNRSNDRRSFVIVGRIETRRETARAAFGVVLARCCVSRATLGRLELVDISHGIPGGKDDVRSSLSTTLVMLLIGTGLVLLVVCCNTASLFLVRGAVRQREIAVRLSLGADRARLVSQLVAESLPLAVAGGAAGFAIAAWATSAFVGTMPPAWSDYAEIARFRPSLAVFGFAAGATIISMLGFALYPAVRATRQDLAHALRSDARATRGRGQGVIARGVVVAQFALTLVLVGAAGLLALTLGNLSRVDLGFTTEHTLIGAIETRGTQYERGGIVPFSAEIGRRINDVSGVRAAGMATYVPLFGGRNARHAVEVPGETPLSEQERDTPIVAATPGYLGALGVRIVSGRDFSVLDDARSPRVAVISAELARRFFGNHDPLERQIVWHDADSLVAAQVVGVASDARYYSLRNKPRPVLYAPVVQTPGNWPFLEFVIRTDGRAPAGMANEVARAIDGAAPGIRVRRLSDLESERDAAMAIERLSAWLAAFVSLMAFVLSAVGLYGVMAYSVARRTTELGIRMALGARGGAILWLVMKETLVLVGLGVIIGVPLSFAADTAIASQLFGVGAHDSRVAAAAILLLGVVATVATLVPARRATLIDPRTALNAE